MPLSKIPHFMILTLTANIKVLRMRTDVHLRESAGVDHPDLKAPLLIPGAAVDQWVVAEDWRYYSKKYKHAITVKRGFVSDLDSVPRIPFIYSQLKGYARVAAIVHDWLYAYGRDDQGIPIGRTTADGIFKEVLKIENIDPVRRWLIYQGASLFGRFYFNPSHDKVAHLFLDAVEGVDSDVE